MLTAGGVQEETPPEWRLQKRTTLRGQLEAPIIITFSRTAFARRETRIDRRRFLGTAALVAAALPAGRLWADASGAAAVPATLTAVSGSGKAVTLTAHDIEDFRAGLRGQLLLAQDPAYDQARRIWNGAFDRHPALIARCASTADVVRAVQFARSYSLLTAVKGGGHSLSGQSTCEGGLMIDLSPMKGIQVDQARRLAKAQPGVLLGELDAKNQAAGLATPLGTASDTGIAGLTLGGGQGRLMRKLGLSCDNITAFELVTADGKVLQVSAQENPDLFWGLRGGGGNFGIVTSFEYQLHPLAHPVLGGGRMYPFSQARSVITAALELADRAPDELFLAVEVVNVTPGSRVPPGRYVGVEPVYSGMPGDGERLIAPLAKLGKPVMDNIAAMSYLDAQNGPAGGSPPALPPGLGVYIKTGFLNTFPDQLIGEIIHAFNNGPQWLDSIGCLTLAGSVARVKPDATAYWNRASKWDLLLSGVWSDHTQDQHNAAVLRDLWKAFEPFTKGYYVNTDPSADEQRLRATYGDNYTRLVALKNKYDPTNLFRLNANIKPTAPV